MLVFPCPHGEFEARFPDELDAAKAYEQGRQAHHIRRNGSLDGFEPSRAFPCLGFLRVTDDSGPQWEIECDVCGFLTTIGSPDRGPSERTLEEAKW